MNRCLLAFRMALGEVTIRPLAEFQNFVFETVTLDSFLFIIIDKHYKSRGKQQGNSQSAMI